MYSESTYKEWQTPLSKFDYLSMTSLKDEHGYLTINLTGFSKDRTSAYPEASYSFIFSRVAAYRNILEEYRLELAQYLTKLKLELKLEPSCTYIVTKSEWIKSIKEREPLLLVHNKGIKHYLICTGDDVIDILTPSKPEIIIRNSENTK